MTDSGADWQAGGFGLYVHWPFCVSKCPYCDFNSHVSSAVDQGRWQAAFVQEIERAARETAGRRLDTIFFGGGTPSLMQPELVAAVIDAARRAWPMPRSAPACRLPPSRRCCVPPRSSFAPMTPPRASPPPPSPPSFAPCWRRATSGASDAGAGLRRLGFRAGHGRAGGAVGWCATPFGRVVPQARLRRDAGVRNAGRLFRLGLFRLGV